MASQLFQFLGRNIFAVFVSSALILSGLSWAQSPQYQKNAEPIAEEAPKAEVPPTPKNEEVDRFGKGFNSGEPRKGWNFKTAGSIPVLSGGRIKPLDSYAREVILYIHGSRSLKGWDPVDVLFSWISFPAVWDDRAIVRVSTADIRQQLLIASDRTKFSPKELIANEVVLQYAKAQGSNNIQAEGARIGPRGQDLKQVIEGVGLFRSLVAGYGWPVIPGPKDQPWLSLAPMKDEGQYPRAQEIRTGYVDMIRSYYKGNQEDFEQAAERLNKMVRESVPDWNAGMAKKVDSEVTLSRFRPFMVSWIIYLFAGIVWIFAVLVGDKKGTKLRWLALAVTAAGIAIHIYGFSIRVYISGRAPVTNMYETVVWVALGIHIFAFIIYYFQRQAVLMATACLLSVFTLVVADAAPAVMDPGIHPLVPVLRDNFWLTTHVLMIVISYAAFALGLGLGNVTLFQFFKKAMGWGISESPHLKPHNLNQMMYRALQFGVVLLAGGTILGGVWADYSWGRFWGWDPKETWALIALLTYLVILHGRYAGWVGQFGFAAWSVLSFLAVVMAWYGVNFVLGVGLHSYGFSAGGVYTVSAFSSVQLAYVAIIAALHYGKIKLKPS